MLAVLFQVSPALAQTDNANQQVIEKSRQQYSMLSRQGLLELKALAVPNWTPLLSSVGPRERALALTYARRLKFNVSIDAVKGTINVTHTLIGPKPPLVRLNALESIARGIELSINGFFFTWMPFMVTHVIPEKPDQLVFQDLGKNYVITFKDSGSIVSVDLTKEFVITEIRSPQGSVRPKFLKTNDGYLLTSYEGDFEARDLGRVTLSATITSGAVRGMSLPAKVVLLSTIGGGHNRVELAFVNYQVKKRIGKNKEEQ